MGYPGGKAGAGVYQRIINQIPPHDVYVEPFLGDGAIMRRKRPARRNIGVELDSAEAARFAGEVPWAEVHNCCGIEWLRHAFGLYLVRPPDAAAATSPGSAAGRRGGARATRLSEARPIGGARPLHPAATAVAGGNGVVGPGGPATHHSAAGSPGAGWFVYCDSPYLLSTRRCGPLYRHEFTERQHGELLDIVRQLPCPVAISGYWSRLYAQALAGWRCISFDAMTRGGRKAREFLWMNYPEPAELHDYRYLGRQKRERERIARKVRTWSAGLLRLPELERRAIVTAINGRGGCCR